MAALIVLALAEPIVNPREPLPANGRALALVVDNGWASAPDWERRVATAERLLDDAGAESVPVVLAFTAEKPNTEIGPFDAAGARDRLRAAAPRPVPVDRRATYARVAAALTDLPGATVAVLSDGLAEEDDAAAFESLLGNGVASLVWAVPDRLDLAGLSGAENDVDGFRISRGPPSERGAGHLHCRRLRRQGPPDRRCERHLRRRRHDRHRRVPRSVRDAQRLRLDRTGR